MGMEDKKIGFPVMVLRRWAWMCKARSERLQRNGDLINSAIYLGRYHTVNEIIARKLKMLAELIGKSL